jgi:hypothetical protein
VKVNFGKTWPKATGLTGNPLLDIHITLWRKTKMMFGISVLNYVESYVAQHMFSKNFVFEKTFYFLKNDSLSGIRLFLSKWKPFLSQKNCMSACYYESFPLCCVCVRKVSSWNSIYDFLILLQRTMTML